MTQKKVHIGLAIDEKLQELKMSKTEFGRRIGIPQQNVNRILERDTIDTGKLVQISEALKFNFFILYCEDDKKMRIAGRDYVEKGKLIHNGTEINAPLSGVAEADLEKENSELKRQLIEAQAKIISLIEQRENQKQT